MDLDDMLHSLEAVWHGFLEERGHHVYPGINRRVIRSRNSKKIRYRWLLLVGRGLKRRLTKSEQAYLERQLRQAGPKKEATYLVVGFLQEPRRIIVLPVETALKARCVYSDKGGIAWGD